jgi:hypothetical protein
VFALRLLGSETAAFSAVSLQRKAFISVTKQFVQCVECKRASAVEETGRDSKARLDVNLCPQKAKIARELEEVTAEFQQ